MSILWIRMMLPAQLPDSWFNIQYNRNKKISIVHYNNNIIWFSARLKRNIVFYWYIPVRLEEQKREEIFENFKFFLVNICNLLEMLFFIEYWTKYFFPESYIYNENFIETTLHSIKKIFPEHSNIQLNSCPQIVFEQVCFIFHSWKVIFV